MRVPSAPQTGKNAKVFLSFNDGLAVENFEMVLQIDPGRKDVSGFLEKARNNLKL